MFEQVPANFHEAKAVNAFVSISGVCPACGKTVQFVNVANCQDFYVDNGNCTKYYLGQRLCPDKNCRGHIFFKLKQNFDGSVNTEIIPDKFILDNLKIKNLPENIQKCITEAIRCYDNTCYTASAIMIRKTLEEICKTQDAKGCNLHNQLKDLENKIIISKTLYDSMFELKYLGNDAAHVSSVSFEQIGKKEVKIGLMLIVEILRALYEHQDLLEQLQALKTN